MVSLFKPPPSPFEPPSLPHRIISSPLKFISQTLYAAILVLRGPALSKDPPDSSIRLVCISDTHTHKPASLPPGDVLIYAGDLTNDGSVAEIQDQVDWLSSLPYEHVVVICGNHDSFFDPRARRKGDVDKEIMWGTVHYLQHSSLRLCFPKHGNRQLSFYGAPQIPRCGGKEFAFQYRPIDDAWTGTIPRETDVLVTHTPPRNHLDLPIGMGCEFLLKEIWRVRPKVHVFGHVHAGYGKHYAFWDQSQKIFEGLCARHNNGMLRDVLAARAWVDVVKLVIYGLVGVLWTRVWGGIEESTLMVNSALTYRSTGTLGNSPQVVDI